MIDSIAFPRLAAEVDWLRDQSLQSSGAVTGAQLCILGANETLVDTAVGYDGQRRPLTTETLGQVRCAVSKPLIGLTIASLVAEGTCDWDSRIGDILDGPLHPYVAACTLDDLLCHRAGLHTMAAMLLNLKAPEERLEYAKSHPAHRRWRRGIDSSYGEACHALLTGAVIEALTGDDYHRVMNRRVLDPSGIPPRHLRSRFTEEEFDEFGDAIGVTSAMVNGVQVPFLVEATRRMAAEWNPSWSGFATARGLAMLFRYMLDLDRGTRESSWLPVDVVGQLLEVRPNDPAGRHETDKITMGRGVHHGLRLLYVPARYASGTFGHFGWAIAVVFADRELDITVGMRFANQIDNVLNLVRVERIVSAIYADLGQPDTSNDPNWFDPHDPGIVSVIM